jgi:hypothetical protein
VTILDRVDRRVLGAVRFVDVTTGLPVDVPLDVRTGEVTLRTTSRGYHVTGGERIGATPRGYYVIERAPELEDDEDDTEDEEDKEDKDVFAVPPDEPSVAVTLTVVDDRVRRYLPRRCKVRLPRVARREPPDSVFHAVEVALFPSPASRTSPGWAVVRASLVYDTDRAPPVPRALLLVRRASDNALLGRGLSDDRGQALVAVAGIPVTLWGDGTGPVLATRVDATLAVAVNANASTPPDPDEIEAALDEFLVHSGPVSLGSGVEQTITIRCPP